MEVKAEFENWLKSALQRLNADDEVFAEYIVGILEASSVDDDEDVCDEIDEILQGIGHDGDLTKFRQDIIRRWQEIQNKESRLLDEKREPSAAVKDASKGISAIDLGAKLSSITESQTAAYKASRATSKSSSAPDKSVKEAILAQYSGAVEVGSSDEDEDGGKGDSGGGDDLKNSNVDSVIRAEQEKREKARAQAQAKKERDKEDREKQKKLAEERKKKAQEKTAKVERRK